MSDIEQRLRRSHGTGDLHIEAADTIARLRAENERLHLLAKANNDLARLVSGDRSDLLQRVKQAQYLFESISLAGPERPSRQKWEGIYGLSQQMHERMTSARTALEGTGRADG